jgi:hypothetical protein
MGQAEFEAYALHFGEMIALAGWSLHSCGCCSVVPF